MRYASFNSDSIQNMTGTANVGNVFMTLAVEKILNDMGETKPVRINVTDLAEYRGERLIMPLSMHIPASHESKISSYLINHSPDIIPVILAISMSMTELTVAQYSFFKKNEPVGCRDEQTYYTMQRYGIESYISGDLVLLLKESQYYEGKKNKIVFSDAPLFSKKYIPDSFFQKAVYIRQELPMEDLEIGYDTFDYASKIIQTICEEAEMVITSRFHAAVLAIANEIPCILINEAYTYRFSWLKKFGLLYTRNTIGDIDWNCLPFDAAPIQKLIKKTAIERITNAVRKYNIYKEELSQGQALLKDRKSNLFKSSTDLFINQEIQVYSEIDYYDGAIDYIQLHWDRHKKYRYAFWGVNHNAVKIYEYLLSEYRNAKLIQIYDSYHKVKFEGISSISPEMIRKEDGIFIFVTTFTAKEEAVSLLCERGISENNYYICERSYIKCERKLSEC